jgi:tetratricopeptide (TPR) repeat protein
VELGLESGISRQHLGRISAARAEPSRAVMAAITSGIRRITCEAVRAEDLFELTIEESGVWDRTRRLWLVESLRSVEEAARFLDTLQNIPMRVWLKRIVAEGLATEAMVRTLVVRSRSGVDTSPARAASMCLIAARLAEGVAAVADEPAHVRRLGGIAWMEHGNALRHLGRYIEALAAFEKAEATLDADVFSVHDLARTRYARAIVHWKQGGLALAEREAQRAATLFALLGDERRGAHVRILMAGIYFERGDHAMAREGWQSVIEPLRAWGDRAALARVWLDLGSVEGALGNQAVALPLVEKATRAFARMRNATELTRARWALGRLLVDTDPRRAVPILREARVEFWKNRMSCEAGFASIDLASGLLRLGGAHAEETSVILTEAIKTFQESGADKAALAALAYLQAAAEARQATPRLVSYVRTYVERVGRDPQLPFAPEDTVAQ